jgi:protein-tyrosine-phosphatase
LLDLSGHVATRLTASAVHDSDVILVMDIPQLVQTAALSPDARRKTFLLSCLAPGAPLEVADPVNGDLSMFRTCFAHISDAVAPIALALSHGTVRR